MKDIKYIGVNDHKIDLFEGQYKVPNGMAYNSYIIFDEKIAIMDSVDKKFTNEWLKNIENELKNKKPDFLIVQHMEPDHSANIKVFMEKYPNATIVSSQPAFLIMKNFFGTSFDERRIVVSDKSTLSLGKHVLTFVSAPMVHWPEVMMTYDNFEKVLFSADAFGKFGALDTTEEWACEARRYYFGIVGKFGVQVQNLLAKIKNLNLDIQTICPLHGPILSENLGYYIGLYDTWSKYETETEGVFVAYTSVYGHTKEAVLNLEQKLKENGCKKIVLTDLARDDMSEAVEDAFRYGKIVLATTTYNMDIFPFMKEFLNHLTERNFQNKKIGIIENGSWAPAAGKIMKTTLEGCKNIDFFETVVHIKSALNEESKTQIENLAKEICNE